MKIGTCELVRTEVYEQSVDLSSIATMPDQVELAFSSTLSTSSKPEERQTKHRVIFDRSRIPALITLLQAAA